MPAPDLTVALIQNNRGKNNVPDIIDNQCEITAHMQIIELQKAVIILQEACVDLQARVAVLEGP